jgi:hypothetical protein
MVGTKWYHGKEKKNKHAERKRGVRGVWCEVIEIMG